MHVDISRDHVIDIYKGHFLCVFMLLHLQCLSTDKSGVIVIVFITVSLSIIASS